MLTRDVYPLERAFELLNNYVGELVATAVVHAGREAGSALQNLRCLAELGGVAKSRAERLGAVHQARNQLQHQYPDVRAPLILEAAETLVTELRPFLRDYARWFLESTDS